MHLDFRRKFNKYCIKIKKLNKFKMNVIPIFIYWFICSFDVNNNIINRL
jgi:hypothetical protein